MEAENVNRQLLTDYLLGRLSAAEQDALAARYFVDDALFEQLQAVEDDLLEQYARGQLAAADRARFESYLKLRPDGAAQIALAQALPAVLAEARAPIPAAATRGWWKTRLGWLAQPLPALVAATGLLLLCGWLLLLNRQLARENQQLRAQAQQQASVQANLQQTVQELKQTVTTQQDLSEQLQTELQRAKQLRPAPPRPPSPAGATVAWFLAPSAVRNLSALPSVQLNRQARQVELKLVVSPTPSYTGYHVLLQTLDGQQRLWEENSPQTPPPQTGATITFLRPASQFAATGYQLTLTLKEAGGTETQREYYFTVVKQ